MKKLISPALILCMACMALPALGESAGTTGTWYLNEMVMGTTAINPADMGLVWTLTLNEDGTAASAQTMMGKTNEAAGTWREEAGTVYLAFTHSDGEVGDEQPLTLADGLLTLDIPPKKIVTIELI